MYELTTADRIWNRACGSNKLRTLPGDRALVDLLMAHGLVMNGGVLHAVETLPAEELSAAEAGYKFYGFPEAASIFSRARNVVQSGEVSDLLERQFDEQYSEVIPSDSSLVDRFETHFSANPSDYAKLRPRDLT